MGIDMIIRIETIITIDTTIIISTIIDTITGISITETIIETTDGTTAGLINIITTRGDMIIINIMATEETADLRLEELKVRDCSEKCQKRSKLSAKLIFDYNKKIENNKILNDLEKLRIEENDATTDPILKYSTIIR